MENLITYHDAEKQILEHYGTKKQELQAVQIMCEQIQIMHKISNKDIADMKSYKLRRQLARIEKED